MDDRLSGTRGRRNLATLPSWGGGGGAGRGIYRRIALAYGLLLLWGIIGTTIPALGQEPLPPPTNVRVILEPEPGSSIPIDAGHWQVVWDAIGNATGYFVYLARVDPGGAGSGHNGNEEYEAGTGTVFANIPFRTYTNPQKNWTRAEFVRGSGFRITVISAWPKSTLRSDPIFFGSHPAPMVTATRSTGDTVQVSWTPTQTSSRGDSAVNWEVVANEVGGSSRTVSPTLVPDSGDEESNPGSTSLTLDAEATWTVRVRGQNDAGEGLWGEATVHPKERGHIQLSISPDKVLEGDDVSTLTVTATVVLEDSTNPTATLGNSSPLTVSIAVASSSTAESDAYSIPGDQLPAALTIPVNATHNSTVTASITGLTTEDRPAHRKTNNGTLLQTIVFDGTSSDSTRVESTTFTIYPRSWPVNFFRVTRISDAEWEMTWDDFAARHAGTLSEVGYEIAMARVDGGLQADTATRHTTTETSLRLPVSEPQPGNAWDGQRFIRYQGFRLVLRATYHPLFPELEGVTGFDPVLSSPREIHFGSHSAPDVTAEHVAGTADNIRVRWTPTSRGATRGRSETRWHFSLFVAGNRAATLIEPPAADITGENMGERIFTVDETEPVWTVEVYSSNDAGRGGVGQTIVTLDPGTIDLSLSPTTVAENDIVPAITVTATVVFHDPNGNLSNTTPLTLQIDTDSSGTASAADYSIPTGGLPAITIPANARHGHKVTRTITGLTIVADTIDDADETIVFNGVIAGSTITVNSATFTIGPPLGHAGVNGDGAVTSADAIVLYYAQSFVELLGDGSNEEPPGLPSFRAAFLKPYLASGVTADDAALQALLVRANSLLEYPANAELDVNDNGQIDVGDTRILYYALAFPQLLGNGGSTVSGFESYRRELIGRHFPTDVSSTDANWRAAIRAVYELVP